MDLTLKNEVKVGIFTIVGLIILIFFVFSISDFKFFARTNNINIIFGFANGVKMSSPVRLAGVDIGEVKGISVGFNKNTGKNEVNILARVNGDVIIPKDSKVWINTLGLLGEKYIEIIPGMDYKNVLKQGSKIRGEDPIPIQEITELGRQIAMKLKDSIDGLNSILLSEQSKKSFTRVIENLEQASTQLNEIMNKINTGNGSVGKLINDQGIYDDTKEFIADIKQHPWKLMRKGQE
jgi:phospholipid/cholesterol/gamma-HCH transport system substrate-binding protein